MADGETSLLAGEAGDGKAQVSPDTTAQGGDKTANAGTQDGKATAGTDPAKQGEADKAAADKAAADKAKIGAPDKYEFKLPDGVKLDEAAIAELTPLLKELNVPAEKAQALLDLQIKREQANAKAQADAWAKINTDWVASAKADKEIGGTEAKFNESLGLAKTAIKAFGNDEFTKMFNATGVGNHPEFIRFMVNVGKAIGEDKMHVGGSPAGEGEKSLAERLYPNHK